MKRRLKKHIAAGRSPRRDDHGGGSSSTDAVPLVLPVELAVDIEQLDMYTIVALSKVQALIRGYLARRKKGKKSKRKRKKKGREDHHAHQRQQGGQRHRKVVCCWSGDEMDWKDTIPCPADMYPGFERKSESNRWGVDAEKEYDLMIAERERQRRLSAETDCWETATKNYQGSSAIAIEETIEHLKEIVELYPDIGRIETKEGQLPLHAALEAKAPDKIIRALLEIYPEAIERITPLGDMPLHIALRVNYGHQTITHLGSLFPEACSLRDKDGDFPLHELVERRASLAVIEAVMGADKLACKVMDDAGHLPIHIAIGRGDYLDEKNRAVVMALINTYPLALKVPDRVGRIPLHIAVQNNMDVKLLYELLKYHPAGAKHRDHAGRLPMFIAQRHKAAPEVIGLLKGQMQATWKRFEICCDPSI